METVNIPRVMIVGTGSGCGKTTVTCAVLKILIDGCVSSIKEVASFKCGPDYIDPMFHSKVIGAKSRNLDLFMCGKDTVKYLFADNSLKSDISIIEGVMGMYDGISANSDEFSANDVAIVTDTPQILVVNTKGKSFSIVAEILGYKTFKPNNLRGVILNNTSKAMYNIYKNMIEANTGLIVYGYLPYTSEAVIGSRHLGLITADEISDIKQRLAAIADVARETIDIKGIVQLSNNTSEFSYENIETERIVTREVNIAVAKDNAFCFYYEDNFSLLKKLGANIIYFSPLEDERLPLNIDGIILGGGYPEEYLTILAKNKSMLSSVKMAVEQNIPIIAECGGFMYLCDTVNGTEMVGAIKANANMTTKLSRFGYVTLMANEDNLLCKKDEIINAHEFHYSDSDNNGTGFVGTKRNGKTWECIHASKHSNLFAGYPHLHLWGNVEFAKSFMKRCEK